MIYLIIEIETMKCINTIFQVGNTIELILIENPQNSSLSTYAPLICRVFNEETRTVTYSIHRKTFSNDLDTF